MKTFIVDAFTTEPFKGNPAGICLPDHALSDAEMQAVAKELGFSETAFVMRTDRSNIYDIRFFTPKSEIPLCGHATLGSAKIMFDLTDSEEVHFINIQKLDLKARKSGSQIVMEFPVYDVIPATVPQAMLSALGIEEVVNCVFNIETHILMLEIASAQTLRALSPDYSALVKTHDSIDGVLVTALANDGKFDFHSRYFWPWKGTNEDPVTGGSHTFMAKYWSERLGKTQMKSFQASERTGFMDVELISDKTLLIKGNAVIVFAGEMKISQ